MCKREWIYRRSEQPALFVEAEEGDDRDGEHDNTAYEGEDQRGAELKIEQGRDGAHGAS